MPNPNHSSLNIDDLLIDSFTLKQDLPRFVIQKPPSVDDACSGYQLAAGGNSQSLNLLFWCIVLAAAISFIAIQFSSIAHFESRILFFVLTGIMVVWIFLPNRKNKRYFTTMAEKGLGIFEVGTTVIADEAVWLIYPDSTSRIAWQRFDLYQSNRNAIALRIRGGPTFVILTRSQMDRQEDWESLFTFTSGQFQKYSSESNMTATS